MSLLTLSIAPARISQLAHALAVVAALVARRIRRLVVGRRHRRDAAVLSRADEHVLADLGLSRGDLNDAFAAQGAGVSQAEMKEKIRVRFAPVKKNY